jgi:hypothetical protein
MTNTKPPQPRIIRNVPLNKLSLEKAEEHLILEFKNRAMRHSKHQLQSMNKKKEGRPFQYSRDTLLLAAVLLNLRNLSYRRLTTELSLIAGIRISKSQLHERINRLMLGISLNGLLNDKLLNCAMDTTGFRPSERGLWRIVKHEEGKITDKNGYIKLAIVNDTNELFILSAFIGDAQTADMTLFRPCMEDIARLRISTFYGDGAFDAFEVYRFCIEAGITPVVKPSRVAVVHYNRRTGLPRDLRSSYVDFIRKNGYSAWSKRHGYGKRWSSEIVFSKLKRIFGESIRSVVEANIGQEFTIKLWIYNMLVALQHGYSRVLFFSWHFVGLGTGLPDGLPPPAKANQL